MSDGSTEVVSKNVQTRLGRTSIKLSWKNFGTKLAWEKRRILIDRPSPSPKTLGMKLKASLYIAIAAFASPAFAGPPAPAPVVAPVQSFGLGWYGAIDGGVNAYQGFNDNRVFNLNGGDSGGNGGGVAFQSVTLTRDHKIGGFGGAKIGYVFGSGTVRFAVEGDVFFKGFDASLRASVNNSPQVANFNVRVNSVAFMNNVMVRFAPGNGRFQPYLGAGLGGFYASTSNPSINFANMQTSLNTSSSGVGFAWQFLAGADFYINRTNSIFIEYRFLNYNRLRGAGDVQFNGNNPNNFFGSLNLSQSLIGAGWRFHF